MHRVPNDLCMHADAADLGYGGTLGLNMDAGSPGLWEGQGFWTAEDRASSITVRELRAVRLLLHRHFSDFVSDLRIRRILVREDNQAVVAVLNAMVAASPAMMSELRKLRILLHAMGVELEARWLPTAVNKFADRLSRTWDPADVAVTEELIASMVEEHRVDEVAFRSRPLNEPFQARKKYLQDEMHKPWGDGRSRLFVPPFDLLPLVVRKIEMERAKGVLLAPDWPTQAWYGRLIKCSSRVIRLGPADTAIDILAQGAGKTLNPSWGLLVAMLK